MPAPVEALLSWTVREGVTNVIRHSHASQCRLEIRHRGLDAQVEIADNGPVGVALARPDQLHRAGDLTLTPLGGSGGNGLRGLCERVTSLGGTVAAGPGAGGFRLLVSVPVATGKEENPEW